jgi:general stress protein 26
VFETGYDAMTRADLLNFLCGHSLAAEASVSEFDAHQAAVVGIVVTDDLEIFFDTLGSSRKTRNLRRNPKIALLIGGMSAGDEGPVQYEGTADRA